MSFLNEELWDVRYNGHSYQAEKVWAKCTWFWLSQWNLFFHLWVFRIFLVSLVVRYLWSSHIFFKHCLLLRSIIHIEKLYYIHSFQYPTGTDENKASVYTWHSPKFSRREKNKIVCWVYYNELEKNPHLRWSDWILFSNAYTDYLQNLDS